MKTKPEVVTTSPEVSYFLDIVLNRSRKPMEPVSYTVNWDDAPLHHKVYLSTPRLSLSSPFKTMPKVDISTAVSSLSKISPDESVNATILSDFLACYAELDRRTELNWNEDALRKLSPQNALWGRPTASGGGMYPLEQYVVAGPDSAIPTGLAHYDAANHALDVLDGADHTKGFAEATGVKANSYLVVTCKFWKNSFKYNTFCYHVVSQDLGCLIASWRVVAAAYGIALKPLLYFDDYLICQHLGVDGLHEAPFAVLPLETSPSSQGKEHKDFIYDQAKSSNLLSNELGHKVLEVSRTTRTFPLCDKAHAACFMRNFDRPHVKNLRPDYMPEGISIDLPHTKSNLSIETVLRERHSGFGSYSRAAQLTINQLAGALELVASLTAEPTDLAPRGREPWVGQWVIVAGVQGIPDGTYRYDECNHRLVASGKAQIQEAQRFYPLTNYSLGEVSVIHVMTVRLKDIMSSLGDRGMRIAGVEVGHAGQAMYLGASAFGFGAGAVLGLDNLEIDKLLGIQDTEEQSFLCHLLGAHRPNRSRVPLPLYSQETFD